MTEKKGKHDKKPIYKTGGKIDRTEERDKEEKSNNNKNNKKSENKQPVNDDDE